MRVPLPRCAGDQFERLADGLPLGGQKTGREPPEPSGQTESEASGHSAQCLGEPVEGVRMTVPARLPGSRLCDRDRRICSCPTLRRQPNRTSRPV